MTSLSPTKERILVVAWSVLLILAACVLGALLVRRGVAGLTEALPPPNWGFFFLLGSVHFWTTAQADLGELMRSSPLLKALYQAFGVLSFLLGIALFGVASSLALALGAVIASTAFIALSMQLYRGLK